MRVKLLSAVAAATILSIASPAAAQTFTGYTNGCFTTTTCTPSSASNPGGTVGIGGLTYTNGAFSQSIVNGQLGLGGTSDNLGTFLLNASSFTYDGQLFNLLVTFTAPPGASQGAFSANLSGTVNGTDGGGVFLDFANNSNNPLVLPYSGGTFRFFVNDINVSSNSTTQILSGGIRAVPEPATWALMLLGFGGIGMAMRRRRQPALAQLA